MKPSITARLFLQAIGQSKTFGVGYAKELMVSKYQEDLGKMIALPTKEVGIRLIVNQAPNISGKD